MWLIPYKEITGIRSRQKKDSVQKCQNLPRKAVFFIKIGLSLLLFVTALYRINGGLLLNLLLEVALKINLLSVLLFSYRIASGIHFNYCCFWTHQWMQVLLFVQKPFDSVAPISGIRKSPISGINSRESPGKDSLYFLNGFRWLVAMFLRLINSLHVT